MKEEQELKPIPYILTSNERSKIASYQCALEENRLRLNKLEKKRISAKLEGEAARQFGLIG